MNAQMVLTRIPTPVIITVPCRAGDCEKGWLKFICHLACVTNDVCGAALSARSATHKNSSVQPPGAPLIVENSWAILMFVVSPVSVPVSCSPSQYRGGSRPSVVDVDKQKPSHHHSINFEGRPCSRLQLIRGPLDCELSLKGLPCKPTPRHPSAIKSKFNWRNFCWIRQLPCLSLRNKEGWADADVDAVLLLLQNPPTTCSGLPYSVAVCTGQRVSCLDYYLMRRPFFNFS